MNGTALILSILLVGYSPGPANLFALAACALWIVTL